MTPRSFAFRPRYRALAWSSIGVGGSIAAVASVLGFVTLPLATGALGIALGAAYLASPTWRITVTVDETGLTVASPKRTRFQLAWADVVRVVASPSTSTCFVDGGAPERSLLVPGDGAPAPYDIADRKALVEAILAHVPADKVRTVASLDQAADRE
ncbi:MAG TPA: hypothetical protein VFT22_18570 [Kofleriaceae bacterium]|nr:hypothetical protein [Kofleriaceae bacterium]